MRSSSIVLSVHSLKFAKERREGNSASLDSSEANVKFKEVNEWSPCPRGVKEM